MRLKNAARHFNQTPCYDAYSGRQVFKGQFGLYDDSKRDSETAERRILSLSEDDVLPARRTITAMGLKFIIGHGNPDGFMNNVVRIGYVVHEATELAQVRTLADVCLNQAGFTAWCAHAWIKNASFTEQSSKLTPEYNLHFAIGEPVEEECLVTYDGHHYFVRTVRQGPAGTLICFVDELSNPVIETVTVGAGTWDPVTETMSGGTTSNVRIVRMRWQSLFKYRNSRAPTFGPEDIQIAIAKSAVTAKPGMDITLSDGTWQLASVADEGSVWLCRAVQHG